MKVQFNFRSAVIEIICMLYVLLFVYAAVSKILDFENFQVQLGQSPLLSAFAQWVSWLVPFTEILISIFLIFYSTRTWGLVLSLILMFMFTVYIFIILYYSSYVPCSCGGILEKLSWNAHLVFNLIFVALAFIGLKLQESKKESSLTLKTYFKTVVFSCLFGTAAVVILFLWSEEIMHHSNPFQRRYPKNAVVHLQQLDLKFNSFYIAGFSAGRLYLGNYSNPQILVSFESTLKNKSIVKIDFDPGSIAFQNVTLNVKGSYFYIKDGSVPALFRGNVKNFKIDKKLEGIPYFNRVEAIDSLTMIFRSNNGRNMENRIGIFSAEKGGIVNYKDSLLEKQIDGIFDTDGILMYSQQMERMVYLYFYRNEFVVADNNGKMDYVGHTIDTTSKAKIKVTEVKDGTGRKMSAPPLVVNANASIFRNLLFVNSRISGRYEDKKRWGRSSVIDVYDIKSNTYILSFAIDNITGDKLKSFTVTDTNLYALVGNYLVAYQLGENLKKELKHTESINN